MIYAITFIHALFLSLFFWGSLAYITVGGEPQKITRARAAIGIGMVGITLTLMGSLLIS